MEPNKEANKPRISYRYYELPEGELVQAITGEDWVCTLWHLCRGWHPAGLAQL